MSIINHFYFILQLSRGMLPCPRSSSVIMNFPSTWAWVDNDWTYPWNCTYDISLCSIFMFFLCPRFIFMLRQRCADGLVWFRHKKHWKRWCFDTTNMAWNYPKFSWRITSQMRKCGLYTTRMNVTRLGCKRTMFRETPVRKSLWIKARDKKWPALQRLAHLCSDLRWDHVIDQDQTENIYHSLTHIVD